MQNQKWKKAQTKIIVEDIGIYSFHYEQELYQMLLKVY